MEAGALNTESIIAIDESRSPEERGGGLFKKINSSEATVKSIYTGRHLYCNTTPEFILPPLRSSAGVASVGFASSQTDGVIAATTLLLRCAGLNH